MKTRTGTTLLAATLLILLPALASSQEGGTIDKRKEGTYFIEVGEVFLHTDDVPFGIGRVDSDGLYGPLAPGTVGLETTDIFYTSPRLSLGLNRPDGKWKIAVSFLDFDAENSEHYKGVLGVSEFDETLGIPGVSFTRSEPLRPVNPPSPGTWPNVVEEARASMDRDVRFFDISWERNMYETKRHRFRLLTGARYSEHYQTAFVGYLYGEETVGFPGGSTTRFNDVQTIQGRAGSNRLGLKAGVESRFKLGNRFRIITRGQASLAEESVVVQYQNFSTDLVGTAISVANQRIIRLQALAPYNVKGRDLGALDFGIRSENQHKFVWNADLQVRGEWTIGNTTPHFTLGLAYDLYAWFDVPTARGAIEGFRANADTIEMVLHDGDYPPGQQTPTDPRDDWMETIVRDASGNRIATSSIVRRSDVTYDGLQFFVRFDF